MLAETLGSIRLPIYSLRIMSHFLAEYGIDTKRLVEGAGVDPSAITDPWGTVTGTQELRFEQLFMEAAQHIPGAAYKIGLRYKLFAYGPLGLMVMVSPTVSEAMREFTRMQALGYSILEYRLVEAPDGSVALYAGDEACPPAMRAFMHERALGSVPTFLRDLRQNLFPLKYIESPLARDAGWMRIEDDWQTEVRYGSRRTAFHFEDGAGDLPLPLADADLFANYRRLCESQLETSPNIDGFVNGVFQQLMNARGPFPAAAEVAASLNISERTLHRRLSERQTSFGRALDTVRLRRARELLDGTSHDIQTISDKLGFAEVASFSRFFRRVAGASPSVYRRNSKDMFSRSDRQPVPLAHVTEPAGHD